MSIVFLAIVVLFFLAAAILLLSLGKKSRLKREEGHETQFDNRATGRPMSIERIRDPNRLKEVPPEEIPTKKRAS